MTERGEVSVVERALAAAAREPERPASQYLPDGEGSGEISTGAAFLAGARKVARALEAHRGAPVLLAFPPGVEFASAFFGALVAGAVAVPVPAPDGSPAVTTRLSAIGASARPALVLTSAAGMAQRALAPDALSALPWLATDLLPAGAARPYPSPGADAVAYLQYTSGSTRSPRGVAITHGNLAHNCAAIEEAYGFDSRSVLVSWVPAHHDLGLIYGVVLPRIRGFLSVSMSPRAFVERPSRWLHAISRHRGTHSVAPNFAFDLVVAKSSPAERAGLDLGTWEVALNGAEPIRHETEDRFVETFGPHGFRRSALSHSYGLSEATAMVTAERAGRRSSFLRLAGDALARHRVVVATPGQQAVEVAGCGVPSTGTSLAIVDPDTGRETPPDGIGEIWAAGPSVGSGYHLDDAASHATFGSRLTGEQPWLRTGDLGFLRDGELFVTGRCRDLLVVRGENHYPQDLEWAIGGAHPALRPSAVAVFAVDDGRRERVVVAAEVTSAEDAPAVFEAIRRALLPGGLPADTVLLLARKTLPLTSSGKIQRAATRRAFEQGQLPALARWDAASGEVVPPASTGLEAQVLAVFSARLGVSPAAICEVGLRGLGLDSIAVVELGEILARTLGISIYPGAVRDHETMDSLVAFLQRIVDRRTQGRS